MAVRGEYVRTVEERFDDVGIDIPYPHRAIVCGIDVSGGSAVSLPAED